MARTSEQLSPDLHSYLVAHSLAPDPLLRDLAAETERLFPSNAGLQISPEQGSLMTLLTRALGARHAVEIGTFTGYSSVCIARGLAPGGTLLCCDISEEWTSVARGFWKKAGLEDTVDLRIGPAGETLRALPEDARFDLAFIDADKPGYVDYWEQVVPRMRSNGVILVDNTFAHGGVVDPSDDSPMAAGIRAFNDHAAADPRTELVMIPIGDGLTFARVK